jgi:uncharacterized membrane protein
MPGPQQRLSYIDWMRGLACVLMFQTHCYDSWLSPQARKSTFFMYSQLGGTFPAPLFLFLAGISFALVTERMRAKGVVPVEVARFTIKRGAEIYGFGLLFRLQEWLIAFPWAPWTDLLRMDVLNCIGVSMMLMGVVCWLTAAPELVAARKRGILGGAATAMLISLLTPPIWTTWRPAWLPWPIQSVIDGVHTFGVPQAWLFPIFPWTAFAFAGLACGLVLLGDVAKTRLGTVVTTLGAFGALLIVAARWLDHRPGQFYAVYDFWHTSPNFFLIRVGMLLLILFGAYAWCRWGAGQWGFSPLVQMGQTSLLVYWVHIEFVYGRFSILKKGQQSVASASIGLAIIFVSMLLLSVIRTRMKEKKTDVRALFRRAAGAGASSPA